MSDLTDFGEEVNIHKLYNAASQDMNTLQYANEPHTWEEAKSSTNYKQWEQGY